LGSFCLQVRVTRPRARPPTPGSSLRDGAP
jgi:hypothetical protein